nr:MAG TPA: hypothetical protein [Caudoviricetes sp.]
MFDLPLAFLKLVLQIHIEQKLFGFYNLQLNLLSYFICIRIVVGIITHYNVIVIQISH